MSAPTLDPYPLKGRIEITSNGAAVLREYGPLRQERCDFCGVPGGDRVNNWHFCTDCMKEYLLWYHGDGYGESA